VISTEQQDTPPEREWRGRAACRNEPPELFFPTAESGPGYRAQVAEAKAVCRRCPVRADCLAEALARIPYGIAGGLTEHERRRLRTGTPTTTTARERSRGGNRAPLRISHPHNPLAGTRAAEEGRG
jgi:WhiB family redox-sensing transcriptional regulator